MSAPALAARASRAKATLAAAAAVLWVPVALVHPVTFDEVLDEGRSARWVAAHVAQLALAPLVALSLLYLLGALAGRAASVARVAVVVWAALFSAFEAVAGLATGVLVRLDAAAAAVELFEHRGVGGEVSVLGALAHPSWAVVVIATAVALRANGARPASHLTMFLALPFALVHVGVIAALSLVALAIAIWTALAPPPFPLGDGAAPSGRPEAAGT